MEFLIALLVVVLVVMYIASKTIRIVPQATVMIIERLGRFNGMAGSGMNVILPFLDRPRQVFWTSTKPGMTQIDLREQFTDLLPQPVITRDNVTIMVDSVIYWQITDPIKAIYEVNDLVGGTIDASFFNMTLGKPQAEAGTLRALAVTAKRRVDGLPNVPTMAEVMPGFPEMRSWVGVFAPAGTPEPIVARLNADLDI